MYFDGFKNIRLCLFHTTARRMTTRQGRDKGVIAFFVWFNDNSKLTFVHDCLLLDYIFKFAR